MQTTLDRRYADRADVRDAEAMLRRCVHCGFCTATCPTYQLTGDELDGPRGRIYLIKQILEGAPPTHSSRHHLDRCLTCLSCETTCPSGVEYRRLLETGRRLHAEQLPRGGIKQLYRSLLRAIVTRPARLRRLLRAGHAFRFLLPDRLRRKLPPLPAVSDALHHTTRGRRLILPRGCAQQVAAPQINDAAAQVFDALGYGSVTTNDVCCGAMDLHMDADDAALDKARHNIDAWWPLIEQGAEAIVVTASGCGVMVKDYGRLLANDPDYSERAARVSALARDPVEIVEQHPGLLTRRGELPDRIVYHAPCTQQHGLKIRGRVERQLKAAGYHLLPHRDGHLCCGSAGAYSLLQPALSEQLKRNRLEHLQQKDPELIATANIGCLLHLQTGTDTPVRHWLELLAPLQGNDRGPGRH